ncbi:MAG: ornithine cyclodeaminase family protein, partial [Paracoccaceae bacterium]
MGANWVTAVRTAGLSAVAAKRLADRGARVIAFVGCGVQARSHLDAFAAMFPLKEVRAFGRGPANVGRLCELAGEHGLRAVAPETPRAALEGADIVVSSITLDYSVEPYLDARWLKPGAFAAITDLAIPWDDAGMAAFGRIYVDDLEQEASAERRMVAPELITGDLSALVCDEPQAAHDPGIASAFVFRGMALGDLAVAALAYRRATGG